MYLRSTHLISPEKFDMHHTLEVLCKFMQQRKHLSLPKNSQNRVYSVLEFQIEDIQGKHLQLILRNSALGMYVCKCNTEMYIHTTDQLNSNRQQTSKVYQSS